MPLINFSPEWLLTDLLNYAYDGVLTFGYNLVSQLQASAAGIPIKESDMKHLAGLISSIAVTYSNILKDEVRLQVSSGKYDEEDAFIGVYYEYGTGVYAERESLVGVGNDIAGGWNPMRPEGMGQPIIGRGDPNVPIGDTFTYIDLGGTIQESTGRFVDVMESTHAMAELSKYIGGGADETVGSVPATHWFSDTVLANIDLLPEFVMESIIRHFNPRDILSGSSVDITI